MDMTWYHNKLPGTVVLCVVLLCCGVERNATADALMVTRAMKATTVAEIYIEEDSVRVELEVGVTDLGGFRNILPDGVYEKLGYDPKPLAERLGLFFGEEWLVGVGGRPLPGRITRMGVRERVERDEVTGEPLPSRADEIETVVFIAIAYSLPGHPTQLSLRPPMKANGAGPAASIGFVAYHMNLPVTDFRYLGGEETLDLDWDDPWYSRFRNRNLKRRFDAPVSAFLYIENFEVRKEIIARPIDLQGWVDLGLTGKDTIRVADQDEMKERVVAFLAARNPVTIDGATPPPILDRIHFVRRSLRRTGVIDPPEDLPTTSATLGIIFVYPVDSLPQEVSMSWELFSERIQIVPSSATDEAGGLPYSLTPGDSVLVWKNYLTNPTSFALVDVALPGIRVVEIPLLSAVCLIGLLGAGILLRRRDRGRAMLVGVAVLSLAGAILLWPFAKVPLPFTGGRAVADSEVERVVGGLLTNVYRAFDFRDESTIYDTLAHSVSGDLLTEIYLETRRQLELRNQGGALVKVKDVVMQTVEAEPIGGGDGFVARCTWNVTGSVGHWGHIHTRINRYDATLTVQPVDGVWKITALELIEEERVTWMDTDDRDFQS
ncbi:MAG: hypothetical protein IH969_04305 [Candidatus Krumholzibacteriota bacterium]|nr:hypothetical protein [Candidatus Krumholzibacteriota bacterium]